MNEILLLFVVASVVAILVLLSQYSAMKQKDAGNSKTIAQLQGQLQQLQGQIQQRVQEQYQSWRDKEYESIRLQQKEIAQREAVTLLQQWKYESETTIRSNAIQRSQSVIIGKVTEHLIPYMPNFAYNPKDVRFIGSPIDLIIFDGMDNEEVREVVFVEVKTGAATLTKRERQIRDVISAGKVKWLEMRLSKEPSNSLPTRA
jgi:predicted Holliday junction resolvase-like endonuclease